MTSSALPRLSQHHSDPIVSAVITTYNHEHYIEQAVRSVLEQETTFPVEILIAEDCSTDGTRVVLRKLKQVHGDKLTLLLREKNLGLSANLQDCRSRAKGRYIAILEGDDYWIDPRKLQKQHDAMEANPDWSMCFAACRVFYGDKSEKERIVPIAFPEKPLQLDDFLTQGQVQTMSVAMYRQGIVTQTPSWHAKLRIGDWALNIMHAQAGPVGFLPEVLTAYRVHRGGLWSGLETFRQWQEILELFAFLQQHFEGELASKMSGARQWHFDAFRDRVADLEKVERRYCALKLDRVAALWRNTVGRWRR